MKSVGKFIVLALTLAFRVDTQQPPIAFVDVAVVPMDKEQILSHQIVLVVSGRIAQVGPAASVKVPADAYRIDGRGKFLMPGLADMHVHLIRSALQETPQPSPSATTCLASGERYRTAAGLRRERRCTSRPASASSENAQENRALGLLFVANGITTVRNMWGDPAIDTFAREVESGRVLGPHVYSTGPITEGNPPVWEGSRIVETKVQAQEAVRDDKRAGYIAVKVYDWLSKDAYNALVSAARSEGMPVVGHVPVEVTLREAIAARQDSIEHLTGFLEALQPEASVPDKSASCSSLATGPGLKWERQRCIGPATPK
jgi:imidazolonepropionase-like amidohydrolase